MASLLYDAKADLPPELRQQLLDHYLNALRGYVDLEPEAFMQHYYAYVYIRIMQALGAYGFRGFYERKSHFLQSVPYALKNLEWLLQNVELPIALPTLIEAFTRMQDSEKLREIAPKDAPPPAAVDPEELRVVPSKERPLTVRVFSFSYRRGIPKDETGHGGAGEGRAGAGFLGGGDAGGQCFPVSFG